MNCPIAPLPLPRVFGEHFLFEASRVKLLTTIIITISALKCYTC